VDEALAWYERDRPMLALEFLGELRATFDRITAGPLGYQIVRLGVREAVMRRFPYTVFYTIEADVVLVMAVVHTSRNPVTWQRRVD
jgi:toxin ParE1/3/4